MVPRKWRAPGWIGGAILAWVPIGVAILVVSAVRFLVLIGTWNRPLAFVLSMVPGAAIVLWTGWVVGRRAGGEFDDVRLGVATVWVLASAAFRAVWVGPFLGGGWELIRADYTVEGWQPWPVLLGWIFVVPFLFRRRASPAPASPGSG